MCSLYTWLTYFRERLTKVEQDLDETIYNELMDLELNPVEMRAHLMNLIDTEGYSITLDWLVSLTNQHTVQTRIINPQMN